MIICEKRQTPSHRGIFWFHQLVHHLLVGTPIPQESKSATALPAAQHSWPWSYKNLRCVRVNASCFFIARMHRIAAKQKETEKGRIPTSQVLAFWNCEWIVSELWVINAGVVIADVPKVSDGWKTNPEQRRPSLVARRLALRLWVKMTI